MTQPDLDLSRAAERRFDDYLDAIAAVLGHADRTGPARAYCTGLLLPGERKSIEPLAARLAPQRVQAIHQSLHHLVAKADWRDEAVLQLVREQVLPAVERHGPIRYWIVDDTGFPKKGRHSVGVARQYCGQLGKRDNSDVRCQRCRTQLSAPRTARRGRGGVERLRSAGGRVVKTTVGRL